MSTDPSRPSPDPKIVINLTNKANESTEMDLWDIDLGEESIPNAPESDQRTPGQLPSQRKSVSKISTKKPTDLRSKSPAVDVPTELKPVEEKLPVPSRKKAAMIPAKETHAETEDEIFEDIPEIEQAKPTPEWEEVESESTAPVGEKTVPIIPAIGSLSKIEKIAISALCAAFALGATLAVIHFYSRVPTRPLVAEEVDFPVSGKIVEITAASTYWREPVMTGENADVVRRGTQLIPVLKLSLNSKSGAIRVFFRNEDGIVIGDGITRTLKGNAEVTFAATAGFEDVGMHTAYRTGDSKRWVVQVFEAPSATSPREKFSKVLETEISTQIQ